MTDLRAVILLLGCVTGTLRDIFLAEFQSDGETPIGGALVQVDMRVGYLGKSWLCPPV